MNINNGFNVLPWYDSLEKQNSKKWYTYGQAWPLLCPQGSILPFQFICDSAITITSTIYAVNAQTGASVNLGVTPTVTKITRADATYYLVKLNSVAVTSLPIGRYNLRMNTSVGYLYSEEITIINNASECIKLEYWNEDTLRFTSGEINFDDNFHFILYINSTIGKPEYEFEEELTKRLGYKFIESQTSNKLYKFAFAAPEYICDALRLVRMCDYIKLTTKYDSYNALSFAYEPKWQEQGDLAAVDVEFDTDCIIQKLESFNRRVKESFYNALLADIDEPVLFSTDTVAQYYTEYTSVSSINGKLIRQLNAISPIELQDNFDSLVLALDNQADAKQEAKKVFLSDILGLVDSVSKLFKGHYDGAGNLLWIEALSHIGVNGGLTMYIDNGKISLPSLYAGLPIDGQTLVWKDGVLMLNPNIELGGGLDEVELNQYLANNNYAKKSDITTALSGYATTSSLNAVSTKLNDFLEGSDTDTVINKWKELETFLSGLTESDNLATILTGKADKSYVDTNFVTIAGTEDVTGLHNFVNGLKIGGLPITKTQDDVIYLDANLVVRGGITMYAENEVDVPNIFNGLPIDNQTLIWKDDVLMVNPDINLGGGVSSLGELLNVDDSIDATASVDRVLYQPAGSSMWVSKPLSEIGGGGGSVSGDYLPLTGGTISGTSTYPLVVNTTDAQSGIQFLSNNDLLGVIINGGDYGTALINFKGKYRALGIDNDGNAYTTIDYSNTKANLLHTYNYSSYALPLSGGTINGKITVSGIGGWAIEQKKGDFYVFSLGSGSASTSVGTENGILQLYQNDLEVVRLYAASGENNWILNNLGIKTSNPSYTLDVNGTFHSNYAMISSNRIDPLHVNNSTSGASHSCMLFYTNGTLRSQFGYAGYGTYYYNYASGSYIKLLDEVEGNIKYIEISDNIYIGTANRKNLLGLHSSYLLLGYSAMEANIPTYLDGAEIYLRYGANWSHLVHFKSDNSVQIPGVLYFGEHNKTNSSATNIGYIGRGSTDNRMILYCTGETYIYSKGVLAVKLSSANMLVSGGITMYSDQRKKTILNHVELSLKQIADAPLIQHYYNSDQEKTTHVGSIAQYWAGLNDWFCKLDAEGFYTMEIQNCALASAISIARHLEKYESKTDKKIRMLKNRVKELEDKLERLEGGNYGCN